MQGQWGCPYLDHWLYVGWLSGGWLLVSVGDNSVHHVQLTVCCQSGWCRCSSPRPAQPQGFMHFFQGHSQDLDVRGGGTWWVLCSHQGRGLAKRERAIPPSQKFFRFLSVRKWNALVHFGTILIIICGLQRGTCRVPPPYGYVSDFLWLWYVSTDFTYCDLIYASIPELQCSGLAHKRPDGLISLLMSGQTLSSSAVPALWNNLPT